ncbi:CAAX prenyl protease 1 [Dermatophagoides farinae]|uniref:CAAX prenyl protease n=1 Tax=Dermatophagoides farinae TaxID=6954 RepID=A0A922IC75_DERFA|nr:CAAX prenyl protease 1 [Dermatophagoides farinae]
MKEASEKARLYNLDRSYFGFFREIFSICQKALIIWILLASILWNLSTQITYKYFGYQNEVVSTIMFFLLQTAISAVIDIPFSLYSNFVIEERHGFNKYTLKFFLWDTFKKFLVFQPIISLLVGGATYIIIRFEDQFFFYLWLFSSGTAIIFMVIYPSLIAPLFDKYTPLEEGSLRSEIERLATQIKFPLKNIFVVDGSKRSSHSNAYFYGFFKSKQIVLYDTLFDKDSPYFKKNQEEKAATTEESENEKSDSASTKKTDEKKATGCTEKEIVAIICHELGHWYHSHIFKNLVISLFNLFFIFKIASLFYNDTVIYHAFGFYGENNMPRFIGLTIIIETIFLLYFELYNFGMSIICRKFEFQADNFAKNLNFRTELINALIKLNKDNLSFPVYDWLYSLLLHSHPPILDRINALRKIDDKID